MPFEIVKDGKKGYFVIDTNGKKYSKKPLPLARAKRQLAALNIHIRRNLEGGITPEETQNLEAEYTKLKDTIERLQLYIKNREAMLDAILARDPEREQSNKIYLQNLISLNEHLIKSATMLLRMYDIDYALGHMSQEQYELDKQKDTELLNRHRMQLATAKESLAVEEAKGKVKGGIAVKLNKYADGTYGVSDMKGKVLESGLNKQEAEKALTKWYKYQPPVPTFSSEQSAFKKVKKGGITFAQYSKFYEHFNSLMTNLRQESVVYPDGTIEISKYAEGPFVDLVKAYFSESEYNLIINSKLFKDLRELEATTNINDFLDLAKRLHPGKFDGAIRSFINDIQTNKKLTQMDQVDEAFKIILIVMERLYSDLIEPFIQESDAREYMTEFKAAGKVKGSGVHKDSLLASHNQIVRIASPTQRERISAIYFQALAELQQAPKTHSFLDKVRGRTFNVANNARKLNIVQNATQRMNQVLNEGLISNPLRAVGAPPRPPGAPPGLYGPLLPSGYFSARQMGPAIRVRAPSSATESSESDYIESPVASHRSSMSSESDPGPDDGAAGTEVFPRLVAAAGKCKKGKGKDDDDKFALIQKLEIQLINLLRGRQLEKDYDQIDALITNLKSEAESFLVRPGAKLGNKEYVRDMLHRVLPSFITALAKIPRQGGMFKPKFQLNQLGLPPPQPNQPPPQRQPKRPPPQGLSPRQREANELIDNEECAVCKLALVPPFNATNNIRTGRCGHRCHINPCYNNLPGVAEDPMNPLIGNKVCPKCQFIGYGKYKILRKYSEPDILIGDNLVTGGVIGIIGNAADFMIDDYNKARMANPGLPPIEEIDQFLNRDDLLWMRRTLDSYKTWDNYLSRAKGVLDIEMPDNLQEFLRKRNAFTTNMPKMKYYLEHINRILPPGKKEKSLVELTMEAEARGELGPMPRSAKKPGGSGKTQFVKKYLKGQGLPATKKNVAKICDIMDTEGIVFEGNK